MDMLLNPAADAIEVRKKPVVLKPDARIRIGLWRGLGDQRQYPDVLPPEITYESTCREIRRASSTLMPKHRCLEFPVSK
jgi:hypothetical protein